MTPAATVNWNNSVLAVLHSNESRLARALWFHLTETRLRRIRTSLLLFRSDVPCGFRPRSATARRPLAVLDWCNDALTADEAALLALCADASTGRATSAALTALVVPAGTAAVGEAVHALVHHLAAAGLQLPLAGPTTPRGEHDVADRPFALH
jgi:hypothetical protein